MGRVLINEELGCLHVHVQKTAGASVNQALGLTRLPGPDGPVPNHLSAVELRDVVGVERWSELFKFSFVRNPWERLVSWWTMIRDSDEDPNPWWRYVRERGPTFRDALLNCRDEIVWERKGFRVRRSFWTPQLDYFSAADGSVMVDFVGRFENLSHDFGAICARVGVEPPELPHDRHQSRRAEHYTTFYDDELVALVAEACRPDIEAFGYRFGD